MTEVGARLDIVVPACNEQNLLGACLAAVAGDAQDLDVRVIVVANGCDDATADVARAASTDVDLIVVELPIASKPAALNAANDHLRGCAVVYLDADTVITPGTLSALLTAMDDAGGPVMVGPRPILVRPGDRLSRSFAAVWSRLPSVEGDVIGGGCYAVDAEGRKRWGDFPDVIADDGYVRSLFTRDERRVADDGGFLLVLPSGRELSRVLARWRRGNAELGASASPAAGGSSNARAVLSAPELWRHVPAFVAVQLVSRLHRRRRWARADGVRASAAVSRTDDLVTIGSDARALGELRALAARFPAAELYLYGDPAAAPVALVRHTLSRRLGVTGDVAELCRRAARSGITPVSIPARPDPGAKDSANPSRL